jgi:hypothetical protein
MKKVKQQGAQSGHSENPAQKLALFLESLNGQKPLIVVGDGWSALATVTSGVLSGQSVLWLTGSVSRILPPLPGFETAFGTGGVQAWANLASALGIEIGHERSGCFVREFKNKAFREPAWVKPSEIEARNQERQESLWDPERNVAPLMESRFDLTAAEIEMAIREKLAQKEFSRLLRLEDIPLSAIRIEDGKAQAIVLASGEEILCESLIYADHWSALAKIQGLPKALPFTRNREPHGLLQATFTHTSPIGVGVLEGFFGPMNREAGEEFERHLWGYFSSTGLESYWTICLSTDEVEDNHEIAKKLRRMKSTLDKMFTGSSWLSNPEESFMSHVRDEHIRFEEALIFADGEVPTEPTQIKGVENLWFMTDGYGPTQAFEQVTRVLEIPAPKPAAVSRASGEPSTAAPVDTADTLDPSDTMNTQDLDCQAFERPNTGYEFQDTPRE